MMSLSTALVSAFTVARSAGLAPLRKPFGRSIAMVSVCAFALAGCNAITSGGGGNGGGGDGINDAALGVAASPRVTDQQYNLPRGGGRAQVGRPYRVGGRLYTPREDPDYNEVGQASWYGDAFHGRLTANGEVYDMHTLSAAHPTLPLPSYVRVTNLDNNHSVLVRVNDRGPFSNDRIIDLSKRAADVLDFRHDGVARVRVRYEGRAPLHGQDVEWLEASARIDGVPVGGGNPNMMLASAPVPAPTPPPNQIAFNATPTPPAQVSAPQQGSFLDALFRQPAPAVAQPAVAQPAAPATGAPLVLTPPSAASSAAATSTQPAFGIVPNAPIPSAAVGFMPTDLEEGFRQRNRSALAQTARIELAHRQASQSALGAASMLALQSQTVARLTRERGEQALAFAPVETPDPSQTSVIQIGIFGDPANVERARRELANFGEVVTQTINSSGRTLTQVRLRAAIPMEQAEQDLLRTLARQGYTDAYVTDDSRG